MASFNERYTAAMVLSAVGDSLGYRNGQWLECKSGRKIYKELMELNLDKIDIEPPEWKTSSCTIMHNLTARALVQCENNKPNKELFKHIATSYSVYIKDIEERHLDGTCLNSCKILGKCLANDKYIIPFDAKYTSNAAAVRTMCVGLMHHNPNDLDRLVATSLECGRMTHHHPTGYLGALTTALFTSFAIQRKPIEQWGCALLDTLPKCLEYIRETGIAVAESTDSFGHFTHVWENHLKLRNIENGSLQMNLCNHFDFDKNDEYFRSVSLDGIPGSSGFDAPLIAYDAILSCKGNWVDLCVGAICHGGYSNVTGCIAACWYGALYGFAGVSECYYLKVEFKRTSRLLGEGILRLSYSHYDTHIHTLERETVQTTTIYEREQLKRNDAGFIEASISEDDGIDITEVIQTRVKDLRSNIISDDGVKIGQAIFVHVNRFIGEIGKTFPIFRASEIIKVGSYREGTKIKCADEFDFIIVLEEFLKPGSVVINHQTQSARSIYIQHEMFAHLPISYVRDTLPNQATEIYREFSAALYQVVMDKSMPRSLRITLDEDEMVEQPSVDGVQMKVRMYRAQFPNIILEFVYQNMQIHVDLTLALRYYDIEACLDMESIPVPEFIGMIQEQKSVLFVVYDDIFRVTLTEVEVEYLRNKMLQKHKNIYMFLKYINGMYADNNFLEQAGYQPFTSYMLKSICLHHEHICTTKDHKSYNSCFRAILNIMKTSIGNGYLVPAECVNEISVGYLPSVFDINRNLYNQPHKTVDLLVELRKCMIRDLETVHGYERKWHSIEEFVKEMKAHIEKSVDTVCTKTLSDSKYLLPVYRKPPA